MDPMRHTLSGQAFGSLIKTLAEKNASITFKATGNSMFPNILHGDILTVTPYQGRVPIVGDIVCVSNTATGQVIIHRIINICHGRFLIKGDSIFRCDGLFDPEHILGYVVHITRNKKTMQIRRSQNLRHAFFSKFRLFSLSRLFLPRWIKPHT